MMQSTIVVQLLRTIIKRIDESIAVARGQGGVAVFPLLDSYRSGGPVGHESV
jgi:hypothetical protein